MTISSGSPNASADVLNSFNANGRLQLGDTSELTISGGVVTNVANIHTIDTEGDAATDDLDTITPASDVGDGYILVVMPAHTDRTVVLKHGTGNIQCFGNTDITLANDNDAVMLVYNLANTDWFALGGGGLANYTTFNAAVQVTITPTAAQSLLIALSTTGDLAVNTDDLLLDTSVGNLYLNDSANAERAGRGITINQGANDDEILSLKSSDVAHGVTDHTETDTYGLLEKISGTGGGLEIRGFSDSGWVGVEIMGVAATANTTKTVAAIAPVVLYGVIANGTDLGGVGANGNLVVIRDYTAGSAQFIFDAEGSGHSNVEWTTFDEHDDVALLTGLQLAFGDPVKGAFGEFIQRHRERLQALKIVNFYDDGPRAMVNWTRLSMLQTGAILQLSNRLEAMEAQDAKLDRLEAKLRRIPLIGRLLA